MPPFVLTHAHLRSQTRTPFSSLLGKVARSAGWGVARCYGAKRLARTVPRTCGSKRPAFHAPSVAFGDAFPAFAEKEGARRLRVYFRLSVSPCNGQEERSSCEARLS
jgi:hypothetical protein